MFSTRGQTQQREQGQQQHQNQHQQCEEECGQSGGFRMGGMGQHMMGGMQWPWGQQGSFGGQGGFYGHQGFGGQGFGGQGFGGQGFSGQRFGGQGFGGQGYGNQFMSGFGGQSGMGGGMFGSMCDQSCPLRVDLTESADCYCAIIDVPGVQKDAVKISHENQVLNVWVDFYEEQKAHGKDKTRARCQWKERPTGCACRCIPMPNDCDIENATAKQENGVLTITCPKNKDAETKKYIDVK